jgi:hypothetical protein
LKHAITVIAALLGIAACSVTGAGRRAEQGMNQMGSDWSTQCYGRHLVQLPKETKVGQSHQLWGNAIELQRGLAPNGVAALVDRRAAELRSKPHKPNGTLLDKQLVLADFSQALVFWASEETQVSQTMETWLSAPAAGRVWKRSGLLAFNKQATGIEYAKSLALSIRGRESGDVPRDAGHCIEAGIVGGKEFQSEGYTVHLSFPGMPRVTMKLFSLVVGKPQQKLLDRAPAGLGALANLASGTRTLRKGERTLNAIEGQELLLSITAEGSRGHYFRWESPGASQSMERPHVAIELSTLSEPDERGNVGDSFFKSDEDALAFWDAIVSTFRVRPGAF